MKKEGTSKVIHRKEMIMFMMSYYLSISDTPIKIVEDCILSPQHDRLELST